MQPLQNKTKLQWHTNRHNRWHWRHRNGGEVGTSCCEFVYSFLLLLFRCLVFDFWAGGFAWMKCDCYTQTWWWLWWMIAFSFHITLIHCTTYYHYLTWAVLFIWSISTNTNTIPFRPIPKNHFACQTIWRRYSSRIHLTPGAALPVYKWSVLFVLAKWAFISLVCKWFCLLFFAAFSRFYASHLNGRFRYGMMNDMGWSGTRELFMHFQVDFGWAPCRRGICDERKMMFYLLWKWRVKWVGWVGRVEKIQIRQDRQSLTHIHALNISEVRLDVLSVPLRRTNIFQ